MTLDQLRYFVAAATYQHVGKAALSVAISPSVISAAIATLEDELQCALFKRVGRGIELTPKGKELLERSKSILSQVSGLGHELNGGSAELSGHLRVAASHFLSSRILLSAVSKLQAAHPKVVADVFSTNTSQAIGEVLGGRLDLAVAFSPVIHSELVETELLSGELLIVVRKGHPLLRGSRPAVRELAKYGAVIHKGNSSVESCETHPVFGDLGIAPRIELSFDNDEIALKAVLASDRWTFVPDVVFQEYSKQLERIPLPKTARRAPYRVSALVHRERQQEPVLRVLVTALSERRPRV